MIFRRGDIEKELYVQKDSLYIMSGESRYSWTHEMPTRKNDNDKPRSRRVSITFRMV